MNNVFPITTYGIFGSNKGIGTPALAFYAPGGVVVGNVIPRQTPNEYPANNFFPTDIASILISSLTGNDFSLLSNSPYYNSLLGRVGVNTSMLNSQISGVAQ